MAEAQALKHNILWDISDLKRIVSFLYHFTIMLIRARVDP